MSEHRKYIRQSKSFDDRQQIKFDKDGKWIKPAEVEIVQFTAVNCNELVACPFCLYKAKLSAFFISTKTGISQANAKCPECHNGMRMKSLWNDMGASQYAEWVFNYRLSGFWQKCPFAVWKKRLKEIGWSTAFWARYRELKGVEAADSMFSDAERMAEDYGIDTHEQQR